MKKFIGGLAVVAALSVAPAFADVAYTNGPINGTIDAYTINQDFQVADSFTVPTSDPLTSVSFGLWLFPGDSASSVDWAIFTDPTNQVNLFAGTGSLTLTDTFNNSFGYDVSTATFSLPNLTGLTIGTTYWLSLSNLATTNNDSGYWDENDGPSQGWQSGGNGFISSHSFTISNDANAAVPEPGSLALGGTGLLLLAGALRRKLVR
jgi:opacity protein-like surface antigen